MKLPDIHIPGITIAIYGAVLSTATAVVQVANFLRDRIHVKVEVLFNRQIIGDPRRSRDETYIEVVVTNLGKRPVTITTVGALRLFPCPTHYVFADINFQYLVS